MLDDAIAGGDAGESRKTQSTTLIEIACEEAEFFHTADGTAFADISVAGHRETWPVKSRGFRRWLDSRFYEKLQSAANSDAKQAALGVIEARAHFNAPEHEVHLRCGQAECKIYLDLCDDGWRVVEIDSVGWRVISDPPIRFRRASAMRPLPSPVKGGSIDALRPLLNLKSDADFVLVVSWLLGAMRGAGPYPLLAVSGEQGSAKSTFATILRTLIDPSSAPLRALPREDRDCFIAANNAHALVFDNLSGLPPWISDTLCRLASGGGFATRTLYSDTDETIFDAARPIILNGIEDVVSRPDLADRAIVLTLEPIAEGHRRPEKEILQALEMIRPSLLGAFLDGISIGLRMLPKTKLARLPRMADFALWATACECGFWKPGTFEAAYAGNRAHAAESVADADPVAAAVINLLADNPEWTGTASELLTALGERVSEAQRKEKGWPKATHVLSGKIRRAATALRAVGIETTLTEVGHANEKRISFSRTVRRGHEALAALAKSPGAGHINKIMGMGASASCDTKRSH